ncbi:hypothetical protein GCM10010517_45850 [Streptosporangium fragile]|uniref:Uncharacterized protein n=1 Tax=Streptosporangium fragile TaxID=46186 RepID=A0ABP6IH28_9ACTN
MAERTSSAMTDEEVARTFSISSAVVPVLLQEMRKNAAGRRRLVQIIDTLRDRHLLERAQEAAVTATDLIEYGQADLEDLLDG